MKPALLALALAASFAPAARASGDDQRKLYYEDIFTPFFAKNAKKGIYRAQRPGATEGSFLIEKPADDLRVFVIGGSIAQRYMSGTPSSLEASLAKLLPGRKLEVVDCGMGGYDSFREAMVLEEVLDYSPDLIILLTGHNERLGSPPVPLWLLHARDRLDRIASFRNMVRALKDVYPIEKAGDAAAYDGIFRRNVTQMAQHAATAGVPLLIAVPPLNYRDNLPAAAPGFEDDAHFLGTWLKFLRKDYPGAAAAWEQDHTPPSLFLAGRAWDAAGDSARAAARYEQALAAEPPYQGRCGVGCAAIIREAAKAGGASVVELDAAFRDAAKPGLPGFSMFADAVHWHARFHGLASREFLRAMRALPAFKALPWDSAASAELDRPWTAPPAPAGDDETMNILSYALSQHIDLSAPSGYLSWRAVLHLDEVYRRAPSWFDDSDAMLARAKKAEAARGPRIWKRIETTPGAFAWHVGEFWLRRGEYKKALAELGRAARALPRTPRVQLSVAAAQAAAGDDGKASATLGALDGKIPGPVLDAWKAGLLPRF